ncbi:ubiquitin carboxyl-terminal hydrolase [Candidatus Babeliales bacterium]|nr:ubiquitin carboxyl-terminal hydrolase [Candidatus Babeliales bacterium]
MKKILALSVVLLASFSLEGKNRGLENKGNTCFLNTALQPLSHLRPFNEWLAKNITAYQPGSLAQQYVNLVEELRKPDTSAVDPESFTENSKTTLGLNAGYNQEDTEEFFTKFIDNINSNNQYTNNLQTTLAHAGALPFVIEQFIEYLRINPYDIKKINSRLKNSNKFQDTSQFTAKQKKNTYKLLASNAPIWTSLEKDISKLQDLVSSFPLLTITTWHHKDKKLHSTTKHESTKFLQLPIRNPGGTNYDSLQQCLDEYLSVEKMDGHNQWYCSQCISYIDAEKKISFQSPPHNLIFSYQRSFWSFSTGAIKLNNIIEAPLSLQLQEEHALESPITYNLVGFGYHHGGPGGGHYYAYCFDGKDWYCYNDSSVSGPITNIESILNTQGTYTLYYEIDISDEKRLPLKQQPGKVFSFKFFAPTSTSTTPPSTTPPSKTPPSTITPPPSKTTPPKPPKPSTPPKKNRGLINVGNTRFLNASVQALSHLTYFNEWLERNKNAYPPKSLWKQYYDITQDLGKPISDAINPNKFAEACRKILKLNENNIQEDAEEFISKFFGRIMETNRYKGSIETILKKKKIIEKPFFTTLFYSPLNLPDFKFDTQDEEIWDTIHSSVKPFQEIIFSFPILQSTIKDEHTSKISAPKYEPATIISLPVKNQSGQKLKTLANCLTEFFATEYIDDKDTSGTSIKLEKTTSFLSSGKNLIFAFKKYEWTGTTIKKINTAINVPLTLQIGTEIGVSTPITYNLVAFICHRGGAGGGEYRAYGCLDGTNWFKYHDEKVTGPIADIQKIVNGKETYLLFYEINEKYIDKLPTPAPLKGGMSQLKRALATLKTKLVDLTQELAKLA